MKRAIVVVALSVLWAAPAVAQAPLSTPDGAGADLAAASGFEASFRVSYGLGLGNFFTDSGVPSRLGDATRGSLPLQADVGYRLASPHLFLGAFFQYAPLFLSRYDSGTRTGTCPPVNGFSERCSAYDLRFGAEALYHFRPGAGLDPWAGVGLGYEFLSSSATDGSSGTAVTATTTFSGFEFANLQVGGDYRLSSSWSFGPFALISFGRYSSAKFDDGQGSTASGSMKELGLSPSTHMFLQFGIKGTFDLQ